MSKFSNPQFQWLVRLHLSQPVYSSERNCACGGIVDTFGIHSLMCGLYGDRTSRHHAIRDVIFDFSRSAGLSVVKEKGGLLGESGGKRRPADVWIGNLNKDICLDVAVTCPLQQRFVSNASQIDGHAASEYYNFKLHKYAKAVEAANLIFQPIVFEAFGRIAEKSLPTLQKIANIRADKYLTSKSESMDMLFQRISVALQIRNANMFLKRALVL